MNLAAILKARTLGFIEVNDLNQNGKIRFADIVPLLIARYDFKSFPPATAPFDLNDKGVSFGSGRLGDIVIDELKIFSQLAYVETLSNTEDSRTVLLDLLEWGTRELGFTYSEGMIRNWAYISHVSFTCDFPLLRVLSSPMEKVARKIGAKVSEFFGEDIPYHPINFVVGHDPRTRKNGVATFTIQQRANVRFEDNKYFSESPLPTSIHLEYLQELENDAREMPL